MVRLSFLLVVREGNERLIPSSHGCPGGIRCGAITVTVWLPGPFKDFHSERGQTAAHLLREPPQALGKRHHLLREPFRQASDLLYACRVYRRAWYAPYTYSCGQLIQGHLYVSQMLHRVLLPCLHFHFQLS